MNELEEKVVVWKEIKRLREIEAFMNHKVEELELEVLSIEAECDALRRTREEIKAEIRLLRIDKIVLKGGIN